MQYGADPEVAELDTKPVPAGAMLGQRAGRSPEVVPVLPTAPSELTGEHCCGFPASRLWAALALQGSSLGSRKRTRPDRKSRVIGCHLPPVISASRWAVPTSSWMLPT